METNHELFALWSAYISADMHVRERVEDLTMADAEFRAAVATRDAAWERYRVVKNAQPDAKREKGNHED